MKKCSNCFQLKDLSEFYPKRHRYKDRIYSTHQSRCKSCNAEVCAGYKERARWRLNHATD